MTKDITLLEEQLNSFDSSQRRDALEQLAEQVKSGQVSLAAKKREVNLHFHTFFSFNANGWSPSRIAWESAKYGLEVAGIVDFDVLDGMDEFLAAGKLLGLKAVAGLETRVFISELADKVINSPNEPGISYFMASGCYRKPDAGSEAEKILFNMRDTARQRNIVLVERVNAFLDEVQLDYDKDAVPLTPAGNVTERHLLLAYDIKARNVMREKVASFWASKLGIDQAAAEALLGNTPKLHDTMRSKLMKFGGVGYVKPDAGSFPSIEEAVSMMQGMGAIPTATWLDATNPGEEDSTALVALMQSKGVGALNIIPDRNWNIKNQEEKALKVKKLGEIVAACRAADLPIIVGTEMNKAGLPFVDNFAAPELVPFVDDFVAGAEYVYKYTATALATR
ncbi:MAG: hypothetical protein ABFD54_02040 [Armatimonadota bacterium]|nr:hypothetical protein [bacterium]